MVGHELTVEQTEMADLEARDQPGKRDLGSVGRPAEHRFAEESAAQFDAVEAADELGIAIGIGAPAFDGMGMARRREVARCLLDRAVDPCLVAIGAGTNHRVERPCRE
jgi:hypothetical protein